MGSFAVNRGNVNKGTGLSPGVWFFEEFMFAETIFGTATVNYQCDAHRIAKCDVEGIGGKPYELQISNPEVSTLSVFDDDGTEIEVKDEDLDVLRQMVLDAFEAVESDVMDFEMGEL